MKNMKNYVAPKAEVIELDVNKDMMIGTTPGTTGPAMNQSSNIYS
jgi:hypothetical protein